MRLENISKKKKIKDLEASITESSIYDYYKSANFDDNKNEVNLDFCYNELCLFIKKAIVSLFKELTLMNTIIFYSKNIHSLKANLLTTLLNSSIFSYKFFPEKKYADIIEKRLTKRFKKSNLKINNKNLFVKTTLGDMMKIAYLIEQPIYSKDIKRVCKIQLFLKHNDITFKVECEIKLNILVKDPIYIININKLEKLKSEKLNEK